MTGRPRAEPSPASRDQRGARQRSPIAKGLVVTLVLGALIAAGLLVALWRMSGSIGA